jgi:glycosyltransferase involved in cell wall biosynthesis
MKRAIVDGHVPDYLAYATRIQEPRESPRILCVEEREAVQISDLVITHSNLTRELYQHFFPTEAPRLHPDVIWFSEWIHADALRHRSSARPFAERDVDVLFIANSWGRAEKNYGLVERIANALTDASVHVVGKIDRTIPHVTHHGLMTDRRALFGLMGRAKVVASPSAFDAAPGILYEASAMGCNVVASPNCGNYHLCHERLRAQTCDVPSFVRSISAGRQSKYDDHMTAFLNAGAYDRLVGTLARF